MLFILVFLDMKASLVTTSSHTNSVTESVTISLLTDLSLILTWSKFSLSSHISYLITLCLSIGLFLAPSSVCTPLVPPCNSVWLPIIQQTLLFQIGLPPPPSPHYMQTCVSSSILFWCIESNVVILNKLGIIYWNLHV